jgi:hypothetical protein
MADKKLKIVFSGISTLFPGPPRTRGETPPEKAFVLMAANYDNAIENDWKAIVEPHFPFVYVPESLLVGPISEPADRVEDEKLGTCNIYFLENARVTLEPPPADKLRYYVDPEHDLGERPGSDDVADENDIRWLADLRDLLPPEHTPLRSHPDAPGPEMSAIVELPGGTLKAGFSCKSVQAQSFRAANGCAVPGIKRVLAGEFSIEMTYPESTRQVKLRLRPVRMDAFLSGIALNELTLRWPKNGAPLVIRMGNDTKLEARLAASHKRCDARVRSSTGEPILRPRDDDFFLHYQLLNVPDGAARPLPQAGPHQTSGDGCKPGTGG